MEQALVVTTALLDIPNTFFHYAAVIVFIHCFYDPGFQWNTKKALLFLAAATLECIPIPVFEVDIIAATLVIVADLAILLYDYQGNRLRGLWHFLWVFFVIEGCAQTIIQIGISYIFINFNYGSGITSWQSIITTSIEITVFAFIFFYLYFSMYKRGIVLPWKNRERIFVFIYSIVFSALPRIFYYSGKDGDTSLVIMGISFVLTAVLIPVFFYYLQISEYYRNRTAIQEQHIQAELAHFQQYRQNQAETSRFRHDIKNNLLCVSDMLQQGKTAEASNYLMDLLDTVENLSKKYVTGDELLDSIVGVKSQIMEQHGIRFELDGVLAGGLPWKPMDICNVFANALDNAIEACQKVPPERRRISMRIKSTPQFWFVTIDNSIAEVVDTTKLFQKNGGYTSKSNSAQHGIGTYNMKHTVESYGAMLKAECTGEIFILEIMIDNSSPD